MAGILRLSHADVRVPDLELAVAYYTEVVGLFESSRDGDHVCLKAWDEHQHHSLILPRRRRTGSTHWASRSWSSPSSTGWPAASTRPGSRPRGSGPGELGPGSGHTVRFRSPSGHTVDLVQGMEQVGNMLPLRNPPPKPDNLPGMHPPRIDHIFLMCEDVDGVSDFFRDVLEFRLTERILADDGHQLVTFLERSHTPHDLAFITGPDGAFHHVAYWVDEWSDLRDAADICAYHGVHDRRRPHPPRRHPRLRPLLLRPRRQPQRDVHRRLPVRPRRRADDVDGGRDGTSDLLLQGQVDQRFMTVHS